MRQIFESLLSRVLWPCLSLSHCIDASTLWPRVNWKRTTKPSKKKVRTFGLNRNFDRGYRQIFWWVSKLIKARPVRLDAWLRPSLWQVLSGLWWWRYHQVLTTKKDQRPSHGYGSLYWRCWHVLVLTKLMPSSWRLFSWEKRRANLKRLILTISWFQLYWAVVRTPGMAFIALKGLESAVVGPCKQCERDWLPFYGAFAGLRDAEYSL